MEELDGWEEEFYWDWDSKNKQFVLSGKFFWREFCK
jgi:hypothetical protein